jgi:type IV pilus assembly protein PilE
MKKLRGFTLIEILVVIALIGVLAGLLIVSFQGVRKSARDGRRKADIEQIRAGLEMCRQQTRSYPVGTNYLSVAACSNLFPSSIADPLPGYQYYYNSNGTTFILCAYLEGGALSTNCSSCASNSCGSVNCNYSTCNP